MSKEYQDKLEEFDKLIEKVIKSIKQKKVKIIKVKIQKDKLI
jgi:hypothetical protein